MSMKNIVWNIWVNFIKRWAMIEVSLQLVQFIDLIIFNKFLSSNSFSCFYFGSGFNSVFFHVVLVKLF